MVKMHEPQIKARPDDEILEDVFHALVALEPVRLTELPTLRASVDRGRVRLTGNVATATHGAMIRQRVEHIPGVREVINELVDDDALAVAAAARLESDAAIRGVDRRVHAAFGTVYLDWAKRDSGREHRAQDVLYALPGVRAVVHGSWSGWRPASASRQPRDRATVLAWMGEASA